MIIAFLGRQPALGLAELERLLGAANVQPLGANKALIHHLPERECGGTIKFAEIFDTTPPAKPIALLAPIAKYLKNATAAMSGKISLGVSLYTPNARPTDATLLAYKLKKTLAPASVRNLQNTEATLSSAQIIHGKLLTERGFEIVIVTEKNKIYLARTLREQHLAGYTARDHGRPKRDAFVGMLPPKLAQIMINLATPYSPKVGILLDPFCGTGVVLQEALLYGIPVSGSDLSEKMIDYTAENLAWLKRKYPSLPYNPDSAPLAVADAMTNHWPQPIAVVVTEGYLGTPFSAPPTSEKLQQVIRNCDHIIRDFLANIGRQLQPSTPLCIAVPCWYTQGQIYHLPLLDDITKLGYNYIDFTHVSARELIYHRESQIVGRELLVISKQ